MKALRVVVPEVEVSPQARRARLQAAVLRMAHGLAIDQVTTTRVELEALAALCEEAGLVGEAARVRRWLS
jgi:hypothetical protein